MSIRLLARTGFVWSAGALLVLIALSASRLEASCGDYVTVAGQLVHSSHEHSGPMNGDASQTGGGGPSDGRPIPCGCTGASCSNDSLPAAPAPRIVTGGQELAAIDARSSNDVAPSVPLATSANEAAAEGHRLGILRPPR